MIQINIEVHLLKKIEIEKLKKYKVTQEILNNIKNENICPVCKDEFVIDDILMDLPCEHYYYPLIIF